MFLRYACVLLAQEETNAMIRMPFACKFGLEIKPALCRLVLWVWVWVGRLVVADDLALIHVSSWDVDPHKVSPIT